MNAPRLPIIIVTPDVETREGRRGPSTSFQLGEDYARALQAAGGLPLVAPYTEDPAYLDQILDGAQGLLLTGGDFDVDPALFGAEPHPALGTLKPNRTHFELALLERAEARGLPVLGICGGMQLMNVVHGGTLFQDLDSENPSEVEHQQVGPKKDAGHTVRVHGGGVLHGLWRVEEIGVNSTHHQAIRTLAMGFAAECTAPDGIIEGFSRPQGAFYLGVQWHPESMADPRQALIYQAFVQACLGA
jgi:putative glutamine amidotransferase